VAAFGVWSMIHEVAMGIDGMGFGFGFGAAWMASEGGSLTKSIQRESGLLPVRRDCHIMAYVITTYELLATCEHAHALPHAVHPVSWGKPKATKIPVGRTEYTRVLSGNHGTGIPSL
jgi:hypothetical protein